MDYGFLKAWTDIFFSTTLRELALIDKQFEIISVNSRTPFCL